MASLNAEARAARIEAQRMRTESQVLKRVVHGNLARSRVRLERAQREADKARARRVEPMPSPWSELRWAEPYETFDRTLVPVD